MLRRSRRAARKERVVALLQLKILARKEVFDDKPIPHISAAQVPEPAAPRLTRGAQFAHHR